MNIKQIVYIMLTAGIAAGLYFMYKKPSESNLPSQNSITIGTVGGYAPFVSVNQDGDYEGFDVDVITAIAQHLNKKLVLKELGSMVSLFMALEQGSIDAAIWGLSIIPDRLKNMNMIPYYGEKITAYPLLFWEKIPETITSIEDMHGLTIAVEPNSAQDEIIKKYDFVTIQPTDKIDDALLAIQYGKADAALVEPAIARKFKAKYPQIQILPVELLPDEQEYGVGIAVRKDRTEIKQQLENAVQTLKKDNRIEQFAKKWDVE